MLLVFFYHIRFSFSVFQVCFSFVSSIEAPQAMSSPLIKFYKIGLGDKNEVNSKGWKMKTLKQHFKDTGFWGVSKIKMPNLTY